MIDDERPDGGAPDEGGAPAADAPNEGATGDVDPAAAQDAEPTPEAAADADAPNEGATGGAEPSAEGEGEPAAEGDPEPGAEAEAEPGAEAEAEPGAEAEAEPGAEAEPSAEAEAEPSAEAPPSEAAVGPDIEPAADAGTEPPAEQPAEPTADAGTEPPAEQPAEPTADAGTEPPAEQPAEPTADAGTEAAPDAAPGEPPADRPRRDKRRRDGEREKKKEEVVPGAHLEPDLVLSEDRAEGELDEYADRYGPSAEDGEPLAEAEAAEQPEAPGDAAEPRSVLDLAADARYQATGKRKTSVARVILRPGEGAYTVNGRSLEDYFPRAALQKAARQPLQTAGFEKRMDVVAKIHGGGISAQAGALRHGVARALVEADPSLRVELKRRGFLSRDARAKERKKAGLKKARKRPQFSKR